MRFFRLCKKTFLLAFVFFPMIFMSCDFSNIKVPSSVSVKTDADLGLYLGKIEYDVSKILDEDTVASQIGSDLEEGVHVYEYLGDESEESKDEPLTYLVHYPIAKTELNVGNYLDDLDLDSALSSNTSGLSFSQDFSVPAVNNTVSQGIEIDLAEKMESYSSKTLSDTFNLPITENATSAYLAEILDGHTSITFESIATLYYSEGSSIDVVFNKTDSNACGSDFTFTVNAKVVDFDDESTILSQSGDTDVKNGGTVSVLIGKDVLTEGLPPKFKFMMEIELSGTATTLHNYDISMGVSSDSKIEKIENITVHSADLRSGSVDGFDADENFGIITISNSVSLESAYGYFETASINSGHIALYNEECTALDSSDLEPELEFSISGCGLDLTMDDFTEDSSKTGRFINKYCNLSGQTLDLSSVSSASEAVLSVSGTVAYEIYGKSIDLTSVDTSTLTVNFNAESVIESLCNVKIDFTSDKYSSVKTSFSLPQTEDGGTALPEQLISYVSKISFGQESAGVYYKSDEDGAITTTLAEGLGLVCDIKNTLPVEIPIKITSEMFDLNLEETISSSDETVSYSWVDYPQIDLSSYTNDEAHYVDFSFGFNLTDGKYLTIGTAANPFVLGKDYEIAMEFKELKMDWDSVTLRSSGASIPVTQSFEAFSLDSILSGFNFDASTFDNVKLSTMDVYFYMQKPATTSDNAFDKLLGKIGLKGNAYISYGDDGKLYILGSETDSSGTVAFIDEIDWLDNGTAVSIASGSETAEFAENFLDSSKYTFKAELAPVVNARPENFNFISNLNLTSSDGTDLVVYKAMIDSLDSSSTTTMGIDMLAYIPFQLDLTGDVSMEVMELYDSEWNGENAEKDLLNRGDDYDFSQYETYAEMINKFEVYYNVTNNVFTNFNLSGSVVDASSGIDKTITLYTDSGVNTLGFTGTEIKNVLANKPFHPSITLTLEGGTETEPKELKIKRSIFDEGTDATVSASVSARIDIDGDKEFALPFSLGGSE